LSSASTRLLAQEDGQGGGEVRVVGAHVERDAFQHLLAVVPASVGFLTGAVLNRSQPNWSNGQFGPFDHDLIGDLQSNEVGGPPSHSAI
jgi:hypothetical protein